MTKLKYFSIPIFSNIDHLRKLITIETSPMFQFDKAESLVAGNLNRVKGQKIKMLATHTGITDTISLSHRNTRDRERIGKDLRLIKRNKRVKEQCKQPYNGPDKEEK
jgi:hypothetical protein